MEYNNQAINAKSNDRTIDTELQRLYNYKLSDMDCTSQIENK